MSRVASGVGRRCAIVLAVCCVILQGCSLYPPGHLKKQMNDFERLKILHYAIGQYHAKEMRYPPSLEDLKPLISDPKLRILGDHDSWGGSLYYSTTASGFVLIAPGRDRRVAERNSTSSQPEDRSVCGDWDADQIVDERGWIASCHK